MKKLELRDRRKIYLVLVALAPMVIGAGWLSEGWVEVILISAGIILETSGLGMAAHFSKELPSPESSEDGTSGLDPAEQLIKPLLPLGEDGPDIGLDRPH